MVLVPLFYRLLPVQFDYRILCCLTGIGEKNDIIGDILQQHCLNRGEVSDNDSTAGSPGIFVADYVRFLFFPLPGGLPGQGTFDGCPELELIEGFDNVTAGSH